MRRSKNIEPGLTPRFESDSLESEWGPAVSSVDEDADPPYGMLEFDTCDAGFIDNQQLETPTTREEIYFPSAGEVAFASEQEMEIAHAELLDLLKSNVGLEGVIGNDDRVWVRDTRDQRYPWARKICSLIVTTQAGQRLRGTGWIAGPRLILTAAHNLYIHERGGWPSSVTVIPGRNGFRAPYSYFNVSASNLIVTRGWHHRKELATDLGAIVIPSEYSDTYIPQTGYFSIRALDDQRLSRARANIVGYPSRITPVGSQWWHGRRVLPDLQAQTFRYNVDTTRGQSGSPVFVFDGKHRYAVGIHNVDVGRYNQAVRINGDVLKKIRQWKREADDFPE